MTQLQAGRFRLVTRSAFDGLVCAALLKHLDRAARVLDELVGRISADGWTATLMGRDEVDLPHGPPGRHAGGRLRR